MDKNRIVRAVIGAVVGVVFGGVAGLVYDDDDNGTPVKISVGPSRPDYTKPYYSYTPTPAPVSKPKVDFTNMNWYGKQAYSQQLEYEHDENIRRIEVDRMRAEKELLEAKREYGDDDDEE